MNNAASHAQLEPEVSAAVFAAETGFNAISRAALVYLSGCSALLTNSRFSFPCL